MHGTPAAREGVIDAPLLKRSTRADGWRMVVDPVGDLAVTEWRVLGRDAGKTWLELCPRTGRTHQIRVHCAHLGHPLLGDPVYGDGQGQLQLLARSLRLPLDPIVAAMAEPPPHMLAELRAMTA